SACFERLSASGLKLVIGTASLKEWCTTAQDCFDREAPLWDRITAHGGAISVLAIDEPLMTVLYNEGWKLPPDRNYAAAQTAEFVRLVRRKYPNVPVALQEAYPRHSAATLTAWIQDVATRCNAIGTRPPDEFELDHDWNQPLGFREHDWNWS